jgi:hypothetical protein
MLPRFSRRFVVVLVGLLAVLQVPQTARAATLSTMVVPAAADPAPTNIRREYKTDWVDFKTTNSGDDDMYDGYLSLGNFSALCDGRARLWGKETAPYSNEFTWELRIDSTTCWVRRINGVPSSDADTWATVKGLYKKSGQACSTSTGHGAKFTYADAPGSVSWKKYTMKGSIPLVGTTSADGTTHVGDSLCEPTSFKTTTHVTRSFNSDQDIDVDADLVMGSLPTIPATKDPATLPGGPAGPPAPIPCSYGVPAGSPTFQAYGDIGSTSGVNVTVPMSTPSTGTGGTWRGMLRYKNTSTGSTKIMSGAFDLTGTSTLTGKPALVSNSNFTGYTRLGLDVWFQPTGTSRSPLGTATTDNPQAASSPPVLGGTPLTHVQWGYGRTLDSQCYYWFGPKQFDDANTAADEPWGGPTTVDPPYVPPPYTAPEDDAPTPPVADAEPPECTFKLSQPSTWLEGGICAAVGLLGAILGLLTDLVEAVVNLPLAFLDALGDLFKPTPGALEAQTASLRDAWTTSSVGTFFADVGSIPAAFNPQSGPCKGPPIKIDWQKVHVESYPMDACGGTGQKVATVVSAGVMLMVSLSTFYAVVNLIAGALGLNLNGLGRDD